MANLDYDKIDSISAYYYNLGLDSARVRNLTGAIEYLKRSLEADKRNTDARNLLGLCYYECGETVEALSSWVVSKHFDPDGTLADYYLEDVQGDSIGLDAMDQAVGKYNRALDDALDGKYDMAMIQLKRAVSLHPKFIRAILLLALLYMMDNDLDRAGKLVNKVLSIDCANVTALRYKAEIDAALLTGKAMNQNVKDIVEESFSATKLEADAINEEVIDDGPNIMAFVSLIAGIIIGIAVVFFLVVPSREQSIKNEYFTNEKEYSENLNMKITKINSLENENAQLKLEQQELEESLKEARDLIQYVHFDAPEQAEAFSKLYAATEAYLAYAIDKKVAEATGKEHDPRLLTAVADALSKVDTSLIMDAKAISLYNTMSRGILDSESITQYEKGIELFDRGMYESATGHLEKAVEYDPKNDQAMYYLARAYQYLNDNESAMKYYQMLLDKCPKSTLAKNAKERLDALKKN